MLAKALRAAAMRTGQRPIISTPRLAPQRARRGLASLRAALVALGLGLAPLAASSAAAPEGAPVPLETASSAAVIELVPLPAETDVTAGTAGTAAPRAAPDLAAPPAPAAPQETLLGRGTASYYAARFHGRRTASGEIFDNRAMTAAHRTLPFGALVRVTNPANGASVVVRITDRGPFSRGRMIDVSRAAAEELGLVARGHGTVELALIAD